MRDDPTDRSGPADDGDPIAPQCGVRLADLRATNRACVVTLLAHEGPLSRIALARRLGLSRTTVGAIVADLLREGRLREVGALPASVAGGRRAVLLVISDERGGDGPNG